MAGNHQKLGESHKTDSPSELAKGTYSGNILIAGLISRTVREHTSIVLCRNWDTVMAALGNRYTVPWATT